MLAYLFPGQGSQTKGMGKSLFEDFPQLVAEADEILGFSIKQLCLDDPSQQLNHTQYTQPAIYTVNALSYFKKIRDTQKKPDFVAGHSLGEFNALLTAEIFDFATGLKLVKKRGELMSQAADGGMAAVIGLQSEAVLEILQKNKLSDVCIANYNSYTQLVISGSKKDIELAQLAFKELSSVTFIPLKVSGAFHSPYMLAAQQQFADYLNQFTFSLPILPVLANVDALPYHPAIIKQNLANQITHAVQWTRIIEYLNTQPEIKYEEIGPGSVLTGLLRRIEKKQ